MGLLDYVPLDDSKQSAAVLAALLYEAANDPSMVPRKPASPGTPAKPN
jgi:hypothetical protein